jgi:hypothetical protein
MGRKGPFGVCVRTAIADLDADNRKEIIIADADITDSKVVVLRNTDGKGAWAKTELPQSFSTARSIRSQLWINGMAHGYRRKRKEELLPAGRENPRWVIWENRGEPKFAERIILDMKLGGHELQVGDVDNDGTVDIVSKPWGPRPWNGNSGKMHVDFLKNLLKSPAASR